MSFATIVLILQAALSLLTLVQSHPELPQSMRDNAVQVAQNAITQATISISSNGKHSPNVSIDTKTLNAVPRITDDSHTVFTVSGPALGTSKWLSVCALDPTYVLTPEDIAPGTDTAWDSHCRGLDLAQVINNRWSVDFYNVPPGTYNLDVFDTNGEHLPIGAPVASSPMNVVAMVPATVVDSPFGNFKWDTRRIYFEDTEHIPGAPVYQSTTTIIAIPDSDPNTFVVDPSPFVTLVSLTRPTTVNTHAVFFRDTNQRYAVQTVTTGCGGDAQGCVVSTGLIVQKKDGSIAYYGIQPDGSGNQADVSSKPSITVATVSVSTITIQYAGMPSLAVVKVFDYSKSPDAVLSQPFVTTAGTITLTMPSGTPSGQYYIVAVDGKGNAVQDVDASGNIYPVSVWATIQ